MMPHRVGRPKPWVSDAVLDVTHRATWQLEHELGNPHVPDAEPMPVTPVDDRSRLLTGIKWGLAFSLPLWAVALGALLLLVVVR